MPVSAVRVTLSPVQKVSGPWAVRVDAGAGNIVMEMLVDVAVHPLALVTITW